MSHECPYADGKPYWNKEGFVWSEKGLLCLDFDAYCEVCHGLYRDNALDKASEHLMGCDREEENE